MTSPMNVAKRQNPHKSSWVRIMYIMLNYVFIHRAVHSQSFQWVLPAIVSPPPACAEARFLITLREPVYHRVSVRARYASDKTLRCHPALRFEGKF